MRTFRNIAAGMAPCVTAAVVLAWAPSAEADEPQYRPDQIGQLEAVDVALEAGEAVPVSHPESAFIKVRLDQIDLGSGDAITVADPSGVESHHYDSSDIDGSELWALSIEGDTAEVILHEDTSDGTAARARVAEYSRGLSEVELATRPTAPEAGTESVCGNDDSQNAACYRETDPVAYQASRAVARIIIEGEFFCTAWRASEYNRLLTNNHCLAESAEARATEVQFGYECIECVGGATSTPIKVAGAEVLSTNHTLDFTLFTVDDFAKVAHLPYLESDPRQAAEEEKIFIPGHPRGEPLRIASASDEGQSSAELRHCQVGDNAVAGMGSESDLAYLCDTAGGSSGAPVISRVTGAVVGLHHLGGCPNQGVRMDQIYPHIAPYLKYGS